MNNSGGSRQSHALSEDQAIELMMQKKRDADAAKEELKRQEELKLEAAIRLRQKKEMERLEELRQQEELRLKPPFGSSKGSPK